MHVAIANPTLFRKTILEATISSIRGLKNYERLKEIRRKKLVYKKELQKNVSKINELLLELEIMPKVKLEKPSKKVKKISKNVIEKPTGKISKLETDMESLKRKISNL